MNIYELNKGDKVSVYFTFNGGAGSGSSGSAEVEGIVYKVEDSTLKIKRERYGKVREYLSMLETLSDYKSLIN